MMLTTVVQRNFIFNISTTIKLKIKIALRNVLNSYLQRKLNKKTQFVFYCDILMYENTCCLCPYD